MDPVNCPIEQRAICEVELISGFAGSLRTGRVVYDEERLEECLTQAPADTLAYHNELELASCRAVFVGTIPLGEPCYAVEPFFREDLFHVEECADGRCGGNTCPGVCEPFDAGQSVCISGSSCFPNKDQRTRRRSAYRSLKRSPRVCAGAHRSWSRSTRTIRRTSSSL